MTTASYTVKRGDTLSAIAAAHHTTIAEMQHLNRPKLRNPNLIRVGEVLVVPTIAPVPPHHTAHTPVVIEHAMGRALATTYWARGMCDQFCAEMYGFGASGYNSAVSHWSGIPARFKHPGSLSIPKGALVLFGGGSHGFGHATLGIGAGSGENALVRTIDMLDHRYDPGHVSTATVRDVLNWGTLHYQGWADPFFAGRLVAKVG